MFSTISIYIMYNVACTYFSSPAMRV